jgi:hypothetical protein
MRAALLLLFGLAGCASLNTAEAPRTVTDLSSLGVAEHFKLEGRVSVKSANSNIPAVCAGTGTHQAKRC